MTKNLSIPRGSVEYIEATVTADVTLTMPVELSLSRGSDHTWLPATWVGTAGTTRTARTTAPITLGDDYPAPAYTLFARLTDTPEVPIINAGMVSILGRATPTTPAPTTGWVDGGTP